MAKLKRSVGPLLAVAVLAAAVFAFRDQLMSMSVHEPASSSTSSVAPASSEAASQAGRSGEGRGRGRGNRGQPRAGDPPVAILAADAKTADVPVTIEGVGTVQARNSVVVKPQVEGRLMEILFREGQAVQKGDVLARIDDALYRAQYDQAVAKKAQDMATLENARRDLERYVSLAASNSVTRQQADTQRAVVAQQEALVRADQAAIDSALTTLGYTTIVAPIDGRAGIRGIDVGNVVHASDATGIVTISQIRPISLVFSVPQQELPRIARAMTDGPIPVEALTSDGRGAVDRGRLEVIDNAVDPTTGTIKLKATFPNESLALWPGAFVNARVLVDTLKGVTVVPTGAVQRGPAGTFVYVVQPDMTVKMRPVVVGRQDETSSVIQSGVGTGDRVVTTGFARLSDGAQVQVAEGGPVSGAASAPPPAEPAPREERRRRRPPS